MNDCCQPSHNYKRGFLTGLLFGLIPHSFCIAFLLLSIIGATSVTILLQKFLFVPYFSLFLTTSSFLLATLSAFIYLKKTGCCSVEKIKSKWRYLSVLYSSIVVVNLIVIFVLLPLISGSQAKANDDSAPIFCPAHPTQIIN